MTGARHAALPRRMPCTTARTAQQQTTHNMKAFRLILPLLLLLASCASKKSVVKENMPEVAGAGTEKRQATVVEKLTFMQKVADTRVYTKNIVGDMLVKQGYGLYFYRDEKSTLEMDFFVRDKDSLVPVEVKAADNATRSLNKLLSDREKYKDIRYGIKLGYKNVGFNGQFYTFPYFLAFLLKRFLRERVRGL